MTASNRRIWLTAIAVLAVMAATMLLASAVTRHDDQIRDHLRHERANRVVATVDAGERLALQGADGLAAIFTTNQRVTASAFRRAAAVPLEQPALRGAAWIERVGPGQAAAYFDRNGHGIVQPPGTRRTHAVRYPVSYAALKPGAPAPPPGFDFGADPARRRVIERAITTGLPAATPPVPLFGKGAPGVVIYSATYSPGPSPRTSAERRRRAEGVVAMVYNGEFFVRSLQAVAPLETTVGLTAAGRDLGGEIHPPARDIRRVEIAGQAFTLVVGGPSGSPPALAWVILIVGLALAILVGWTARLAAQREGTALSLLDLRRDERDRAVRALALSEERYRLLAEMSSDVITVADGSSRLTYVSPSCGSWGYRPAEMIGRGVYEYLHPDDLERFARDHVPGLESHGSARWDHRFMRRDGTHAWVETAVRRVADPETGKTLEMYATSRDVSARREAEQALTVAEERFRKAFEDAPIGMSLARLDLTLVQSNEAFARIVGRSVEELGALSLAELSHPDDTEDLRIRVAQLVAGEVPNLQVEMRYRHAKGAWVWCQLNVSLVRDEHEAPIYLLGQIQDVTDRRSFEERLRHMADHDSLTGLPNRRRFESELESHVARVARHGAAGALLVLDLDNFKYINDTLGHTAGDGVIVASATILRERLRSTDVLARLGGDEFAVLLRDGGRADAEAAAEALLAAIPGAAARSGRPTKRITASIGIALFDGSPIAGEEAMINADLAMYDAKEAGRNRIAFYAGEADRKMKARVTWADRIQRAIAADRFVLYAQPIVDLTSGEVDHHELLLRMRSEEGEIVPPAAFLETAERFDLIQPIDRWVAATAIDLLAGTAHEIAPPRAAINLSAKSMASDELLEGIEARLAATGVDPARLSFEITETVAIENLMVAREFAERLRALGCRLALDDFGAGFGSFYYIKHLPFDVLKIDGEFVANCLESRTDQLVIEAVVSIARGLGKITIAEFTPDDETLEYLRDRGVDYAQGYHIGHPRPAEEVFTVATSRIGSAM